MARCLRCKAGNEWIEGDVKPESAESLLKQIEILTVERDAALGRIDELEEEARHA